MNFPHLLECLQSSFGRTKFVCSHLGFVLLPLHQSVRDPSVDETGDVRRFDPQLFSESAGSHTRIGNDQRENAEAGRRHAEAGKMTVKLVEDAELCQANEKSGTVPQRGLDERAAAGPLSEALTALSSH